MKRIYQRLRKSQKLHLNKSKRNLSITKITYQRVKKKHLRWGKLKLRKRYAEIYGEYISSWKFQVVIEEEHLYFDKAKHNNRKEDENRHKNNLRNVSTLS